ncbi:beta-galactoside alpha-2,6-sialyltransferase 2 [Denticeps clupeoides]|uniref:Beta-galactoside alpha-2,6-sialyltransferase 2 n=1 Tax=Denticeps clupeoides TaxID=299321 RepID=A0AAY4BNH6_9TELE|nr:beta-galactoside alpha-2,6-sialyltransferase 2 [Denticeps clupeoides]XP_028846679.1 beta-galactoside alpha-2,6-sialyltransferase 2 [Denticeps clupeoides]XP_028846681.1 beta-galactoside alpha-2,6-sialyltransferase 2 [Denticeps clupeoides]
MKSCLKQWRRLGLWLMVAWALLFLMLFSYFMESRVEQSRSASVPLSHGETRHLASIVNHQRATMGSSRRERPPPAIANIASTFSTTTTTFSSVEQEQKIGLEEEEIRLEEAVLLHHQTQDIVSRSQEKLIPKDKDEQREQGTEEEEQAPRKTTRRRSWEDTDNLVEFSFSRSRSVVQQLWKGQVSVGMLSPRLQKAVKDYLGSSKHHVVYKGRRQPGQTAKQVLCDMKRRVRVRTVDGSEEPFSSLGWGSLVPPRPLDQLYGSGFGSCAVVTSAGAILHSGLGKEIDAHDAVLRFNAAPTEGYERDVGKKTTIRIINSQILASAKHKFNSSSLYQNVTLVAWDPAPYAVNLQKWYNSPDYNLFTPYVSHRKRFPAQPFYILHPAFIWQLWDVVQGNTLENIQPNPPSSGFIGILLMMALCEEVHVYEYIPSVRQTDLCHYHEHYFDAACTLGAYHPLLYEKVLVQRVNAGTQRELRAKGKVTLPGFSNIHCDP